MDDGPLTKKPKYAAYASQQPSEENSTPKNTLYVNNLNDQIRVETLKSNLYLLFSTFGEVLRVSISHKQRGQAFIIFRSVDEANLAMLSLKNEHLFGKPMHIEFSKADTKDVR
ncbi:HFR078Wp [Eremothecium sinecaudum]|uniref:HFR078Wp n=1 Tax=Eremothecium sinecaudum TaxID=45286 RepID=A0A109V077_9SACH|nr:HFR078Wp [Eremothecium sinecaudum]AMD21933.1 HFR078Wp [Eremothecium sinecaudum]